VNYRTVLASSHQEVIVDLSSHWQKLSQYEDISDDLTEEEELRLLNFVRACGKLSHHQMEKRYDHWRDAPIPAPLPIPSSPTRWRPSLAAIPCSSSKAWTVSRVRHP